MVLLQFQKEHHPTHWYHPIDI